MDTKNQDKRFRVIVVGGGPVGLTATHALYLADIDFVVLESRPSIVEDKGASLIVYPHTLRVMHQFGILKELLSIGSELHHHVSLTADGHVFKRGTRYERVRDNHGHGPIACHRAELIEILYNGLPPAAREKVLTGKKVMSIEESNKNAVRVACDDGSVYDGSIVIGADGVNSRTRRVMREFALRDDPSQSWDPETPYTATYKLLFGVFPTPSESSLGYDTQSRDKSIAYFSGPERSWFFLYKKLEKPTSGRADYTSQDIEALAEEFAEYPLTQTVKVKDVWPRRYGAGMTNLEEGVLRHWSYGRIVLAGDSCHKLTTHLGLGFNNGVQDIVVLCNGLQEVIRMDPDRDPSQPLLTQLFRRYEAVRKGPASSLMADLANSGLEARMQAWINPVYYFISRYLVIPEFVENLVVNYIISPEVRKGRVLNYVRLKEVMNGKLTWLH